MKKFSGLLFILLLLLAGCKNNTDETITVSGSTSVADYFSYIAKEYEALTGVKIEYQAIGSSGGIKNAINGTTDFGTSSRAIKPEELATGLTTAEIGYEGVAVITHESNEVLNLSTEEVKKIYTGEITNWSELGGSDAEIVVVSRESGSGTRDSFQEVVGFEDNELTGDALISDGNGNVASTVASNPNAIGYVSFKSFTENEEKINAVSIDGIQPTEENVHNGSYQIYLPFTIVYDAANLNETSQKFIDWLLSAGVYYVAPYAGIIPPR